MRVAIGADAYGYPMKLVAVKWLQGAGHEVVDVGIHGMTPDEAILDYADAVAGMVSRGEVERGILLCMSGGAMVIRANRWPKVRAVMAMGEEIVRHDREASDSNILCVAAQFIEPEILESQLGVFFEAVFEPLPRRVVRLERLEQGLS